MANTVYRDLASFGLPLVTPSQPTFASLVQDIESRPEPFGSWLSGDIRNAAVLLNETGKAIIGISSSWTHTSATGRPHRSHYSNLGSSMQLDVLTGRSAVSQDLGTFILPGSKRLITERGMFGNNLDVLGRVQTGGGDCGGGGYIGAGRGGFVRQAREEEIVAVELALDLVILESGRCVGPDEGGLFDSLVADLELIRNTAQEAATELGNGASPGRVFEMLRPLARQTLSGAVQHKIRSPFARMFANMAIRQLVNDDSADVATWLETRAQPSRLRLQKIS
jgi:hypothetical protein